MVICKEIFARTSCSRHESMACLCLKLCGSICQRGSPQICIMSFHYFFLNGYQRIFRDSWIKLPFTVVNFYTKDHSHERREQMLLMKIFNIFFLHLMQLFAKSEKCVYLMLKLICMLIFLMFSIWKCLSIKL